MVSGPPPQVVTSPLPLPLPRVCSEGLNSTSAPEGEAWILSDVAGSFAGGLEFLVCNTKMRILGSCRSPTCADPGRTQARPVPGHRARVLEALALEVSAW